MLVLEKLTRFAHKPQPDKWDAVKATFCGIFSKRGNGVNLTYRKRYRIASLLSLAPFSLPWIIARFGSDKQQPGEHAYGETYQRLFRGLRYRRLKILEIGVLHGASLLAWRAYFPRAITVGLDIHNKPGLAVGNKTRIYQGDQSSAADLSLVCSAEGPFDIIIDDGNHYSQHQLFSFLRIFPHVKDGGLYVLEDVQTSFWSGVVRGMQWGGRHITDPAFADTCYGWFLDMAKYLNHAEFETIAGCDDQKMELGQQIRRITFEHNLIVIEKGPNIQTSNSIRRGSTEACNG